CGADPDLVLAADDEKWDAPILESMTVAYAFGGPKTQTPTIVVRADPPHGFKGPVMAPAPTGAAAVRLWDAIDVLAREPGFFELTRPRVNPPRISH
ncbi:MAG: disulfide bond formation protein DsbA, partial [Acidimicrobiales bacterium]|nr:disulfide bond formation protein DsbA [Acidimicrobiales bacterium]